MQLDDNKKGKLERLEKKLYVRGGEKIIDTGRTKLEDRETLAEEPNQGWSQMKNSSFDELAKKVSGLAEEKHTFVKKFFLFSLVFFIIAAGMATFMFLGGVNAVSSKNVDIKIVGPLSVGGGQEVSLDINVINNNNIRLDSTSLVIEYPEGTRSAADLSKELKQERFSLGEIGAGESYSQNIRTVFFGEKEAIKKLKISLEYRVENSSALFHKDKEHEISISSAPIIVTSTYPKEINSNQEIAFEVEVASNSKDKINNFLVNIEYPFGFVFKEAVPSATFGNNIWKYSEISPGEKKTIAIRGNLVGQDNEEKVFKLSTGTADENDDRMIAVPFSELQESILIKKPFIGLDISFNGQNGNFAVQGGGEVLAELRVVNNLPSKLFNVSAQVSLKGGALDQSKVSPDGGGFFQSANNTILWDKRSTEEFSEMAPGSAERLTFHLTPLLYAKIIKGNKPEVEVAVTIKGERVTETGSVEQISTLETRKIVLLTDLVLSSKIVRSFGSIENSGPIPPRAGEPTTYTAVWSLSNTFNQVSNVEVRATLPSYVKWTELKSPQSEIVSFNKETNEIVWSAGSIMANTGFGSSPKEVYFQLEFLPSVSQIGESPVLLGGTSLSGIDKVTGFKTEFKTPAVTTNFYGDPIFKTGDDKVVQ